jgi:ATP-binding cassette subfamily B protein
MRELRRGFATLLSTAWRADRRRFVTYIAMISVWQIAPLAGAVLVRVLIDGVTNRHHTQVTAAAVLLGLVAAAGFVAARARSRTIHVLIEKCTESFDRRIMALSTSVVDIGHLEQPEYLDKLEQLRFQPYALGLNSPHSSVLIWGTVQATLIVAVLVTISPLLLVLPLVSVPGLWAVRKAESIRQRAFETVSVQRRQANHFFELATGTGRAEEVRTLRIESALVARHDEEWAAADASMIAGEIRAAVVGVGARLVFAAFYMGAIALVVEQGIHGHLGIGQVVLTVVLAGLVNQQVLQILDSVSRVLTGLDMVKRYLWLVDYAHDHGPRPDRQAPPSSLADGITITDVSFHYPHSDTDVLRDVNLHLPAGSVVAIVGDNGAGKTTLVKLLTAMYRPTAGEITVDGADLTNIDPVAWREGTTAAFQDFARFELLLGESVGVGDLIGIEDAHAVRAAMREGGGEPLETLLPDGLNTALGASFDDGAQLSGGQWQKVALSRAMMRTEPLLIVLDEPTASLDPAAERDLFARYAAAARRDSIRRAGSITLLVSHRFSTVRVADLIVVLGERGVIETGTHDELIAGNGVYAELFNLQAAGYR